MGRVKETQPSFQNGNHFGVLDHNGVIKVAKTEIRATILHINTDKQGNPISVMVKGRKGSYHADIHKGIKSVMCFVEKGDCAFIKWKMGKAWIVGFQKQKAHQQEKIQEQYLDTNGNCDWNEFMRGVDVE